MRDRESDKRANKITLAVLLGVTKIKKYHFTLIVGAFVIATLYIVTIATTWYYFIPLIAFLSLFKHLGVVKKITSLALLDPELKKVAIFTFLFSVLYFIVSWL